MKKIFTLLFLGFAFTSFGQDTIAKWTFEDITVSNTPGPVPVLTGGTPIADSGNQVIASSFTGFHSNASTVWSTPAGNGTPKSISSNTWSVGDYYQFQVNTSNYVNIQLKFDVNGSNTGPKDFKVQYSTDGVNFNDFTGNSYEVANNSWTSSTVKAGQVDFDLSSITAIDNQPMVYFRLVNTSTVSVNNSTVATGGSSRVDNFTVLGASTLPVKLSAFSAKNVGNHIQLNWITSLEINSSHFEIQRGSNGKDFESIATVNAFNKEKGASYSYNDALTTGNVFYRLKLVDKDGSFEFSDVVAVRGKTGMAQVYPNPVKDIMTVTHERSLKGATIEIYNAMGKKVMVVNSAIDANETKINAGHLPAGNYMIVVLTEKNQQKTSFIKY